MDNGACDKKWSQAEEINNCDRANIK